MQKMQIIISTPKWSESITLQLHTHRSNLKFSSQSDTGQHILWFSPLLECLMLLAVTKLKTGCSVSSLQCLAIKKVKEWPHPRSYLAGGGRGAATVVYLGIFYRHGCCNSYLL